MQYRQTFVTAIAAALIVGCLLPLAAQQTADICIANDVVARIRATGPYDSVDDRATAIDKAIVTVLSKYDTNHPEVALKQKDGIWTVYCWDLPVIGVYPEEAAANNITEKQLGQIWTNKIRERLPAATPVSKMEDPFGGATAEKPSETADTGEAATTGVKPNTVIAQAQQPASEQPTAEADIPESAALLLIIDALRASRSLNEDEWIDRRESIARNLLDNLRKFVASKPMETSGPVVAGSSTSPIEPSAATAPMTGTETVTAPVTTAEEPEVAVEEPETESTPDAPETAPVDETETTEAPAPAAVSETETEAGEHAGDPAWAKVPQKQRIGRKFEAARDPYYELKDNDPEQAEEIDELLSAARKSFTEKNFDRSEQYVDQALRALGIN
ncbi:MAG: hypothetical protein ACLFWB_01450, partial [Armatimonadota bacterium]